MHPIAHLRTVDSSTRRLLSILAVLCSAPAWAAHSTNVQDAVREPNGFFATGSVTITWPAFTTAWNEPIPAGSFTTGIDDHGRFSIDLIPNAGALPTRTFYTAQYRMKDGSTWREYWIVPQESHVGLAEVRNPGPDSASAPNGQSQPPQTQAQTRSIGAEEPVEIEKFGLHGDKPRSPGAINAHSVNTANGHRADFYHDPDRNPITNENDSWLQVCNFTSQPGWTGGDTRWAGAKTNCIHQFQFHSAPGIDLGKPKVGPGGWSVQKGINIESIVNSPGISEVLSSGQVKAGIGDNTGFYFYNFSYGGAVAASDEGNHLTAALGGETDTVYTGNVTRGGTGATSLKTHCSADCDNPGDGRYLIDTEQPVASGYVTAMTRPKDSFIPGTFTIDANVNPSSAWGTLVADVATPTAAQIGTGFTPMTFSVKVTQGRFAAGALVCFGGQFHEQALISSVSGTGQMSLTVPLRHAHEAGSWIMQGGPCGTFIEFTANTYSGRQKIRYPVDILGATDSHTLVYRYFAYSTGTWAGGYWPGSVTFNKLQASALSNSNGTVTMTIGAGSQQQHPEFFNTPSIYISGSTNPSFNGICSNTRITDAGQLTCNQRSSTGANSARAQLSYGSSASGNTAFNLWSGAEVLDVLDYSVSPPAVNGAFTLEPNSAVWASGDSVENVHHYAARINAQHLALSVYNPMSPGRTNYSARELFLSGPGISGGDPTQEPFYTADKIMNYEPPSNYAYHGGTVTPPGGLYFSIGLFNYALAMQYAPDPPGSSAMYVGCPLSGCGDGAFFYNLFTLAGNGGSSAMTFTPATNILSLSGKGLNLKNEPLISPTLQGELRGTPASLQFAPLDSSGRSHTWTLVARPLGDGFTLNLPQASGTLALNNSFGPSGSNHSPGLVPDPGPNAGNARFLREDGKWAAIDGCQYPVIAPSVRPVVLQSNSDQDDIPHPLQPTFPAVVAHASRHAVRNPLTEILQYAPNNDGTFRLTVSVFIESRCDSGTLLLNASLSPIAGHDAGQVQAVDCTSAYGSATATITAHSAAGVRIKPTVEFNAVDAGSLRYMVDVVLEQLQ